MISEFQPHFMTSLLGCFISLLEFVSLPVLYMRLLHKKALLLGRGYEFLLCTHSADDFTPFT